MSAGLQPINQADIVPLVSTQQSNTNFSTSITALNTPSLNKLTLAFFQTQRTPASANIPSAVTVGSGMSMTKLGAFILENDGGSPTTHFYCYTVWYGAWSSGTFTNLQGTGAASTIWAVHAFQVTTALATGTNGVDGIGQNDTDSGNHNTTNSISFSYGGTPATRNMMVLGYGCNVNLNGIKYPVITPPNGYAWNTSPQISDGWTQGSGTGPTGNLILFSNRGDTGATITGPSAGISMGVGVEIVAA